MRTMGREALCWFLWLGVLINFPGWSYTNQLWGKCAAKSELSEASKVNDEFLELRIQKEDGLYNTYKDDNTAKHHVERGFYTGNHTILHLPRAPLRETIIQFLVDEKVKSVVDVGGGVGNVARALMDRGIFTTCYDGNPDTQDISSGTCSMMDFSKPGVFVENLNSISTIGVILTWGRGFMDHVERYEKSEEEVVDLFEQHGFKFRKETSKYLQNTQNCQYCAQILVFGKKNLGESFSLDKNENKDQFY